MSKSELFLPLESRMTRRTVLAGFVASAATAVATVASISTVRGGTSGDDDADALLDVCYWETVQTKCSNGRRLEYRCEVCCAGGVCETVQCVWYDVGPC